MKQFDTTPGNAKKLDQLERVLAELLRLALQREFFGNAGIELSIQDGTIQSIRSKLERIEK